MDPSPDRTSSARFPTTHRSPAAAARGPATPGAREAPAASCRPSRYPPSASTPRKGFQPDAAPYLPQPSFPRLLQTGVLAAADPEKGRFRAFLRTDCGFFLADQRDRANALKRG